MSHMRRRHPFDWPMRTMLLLNAVLLAVAVTAGAWSATWQTTWAPAPPARHAVPQQASVFAHVLRANLAVAGLLVLGSATLGGLSAVVVVWNGVHLGAGLMVLFETEPELGWLVMWYVPIEFLALILASTASMQMGREIVSLLFTRGGVSLKAPLCVLAAALLLFLVAASIEARVSARIDAAGRARVVRAHYPVPTEKSRAKLRPILSSTVCVVASVCTRDNHVSVSWRLIMTRRKVLAAAVLAASLALPAATQVMHTGDGSGVNAQWAHALGMKGRQATLFGIGSVLLCGAIANPGSIACGLAGVA